MRHASLFTGIGGFDLGAEWMGWKNVFQVEIDPFCQKVLQKNFPNAERHGDIKQFDGSRYRGTIDVLSGGFPCQPYSSAGKRKGKEDERHLWPEMLRVIREISPRWVVGENVRGLVNWNGGLVFDEVQADLEAAGYEVTPFLLPAAGVNAPHERYRVWFIAYAASERRWKDSKAGLGVQGQLLQNGCRKESSNIALCTGKRGYATDPHQSRLPGDAQGRECIFSGPHEIAQGCSTDRASAANEQWKSFPTQSAVCGGNNGISNRVDRLKALGNAVVPQVVLQIFKAISQYEQQVTESLK